MCVQFFLVVANIYITTLFINKILNDIEIVCKLYKSKFYTFYYLYHPPSSQPPPPPKSPLPIIYPPTNSSLKHYDVTIEGSETISLLISIY